MDESFEPAIDRLLSRDMDEICSCCGRENSEGTVACLCGRPTRGFLRLCRKARRLSVQLSALPAARVLERIRNSTEEESATLFPAIIVELERAGWPRDALTQIEDAQISHLLARHNAAAAVLILSRRVRRSPNEASLRQLAELLADANVSQTDATAILAGRTPVGSEIESVLDAIVDIIDLEHGVP
ncbi:MAG: hypothetical protein HYV07_01280 [Deltaproteobacteria bacterium]|nr:hypothetical protein [Deltaproteobacteria bacterium]